MEIRIQWDGIFKVVQENSTKNSVSGRNILQKEGKIKRLQDKKQNKQKTEFVTSRHAL